MIWPDGTGCIEWPRLILPVGNPAIQANQALPNIESIGMYEQFIFGSFIIQYSLFNAPSSIV